jgi:ElaB/YqjD/DUF883 family membrane-anchored ribosome-binding protein
MATMTEPKGEWTGSRLDDLKQRVDDGFDSVDKKIEDTADRLDKKIDDTADRLDKKIGETGDRLDKGLDEVRSDIKGLAKALWVSAVAIIAALIGCVAALVAFALP